MIGLVEARRIMSILVNGGALTEWELWLLIDYLTAMCPIRPTKPATVTLAGKVPAVTSSTLVKEAPPNGS